MASNMIDKREEIPYDEDGKQLSFSTDAETVYVDGVPLKTWLSRLEAKLIEAVKKYSGLKGYNSAVMSFDMKNNLT